MKWLLSSWARLLVPHSTLGPHLVPTHFRCCCCGAAGVEPTSASAKPAICKDCRLILALLWTWLLSEAVDLLQRCSATSLPPLHAIDARTLQAVAFLQQ